MKRAVVAIAISSVLLSGCMSTASNQEKGAAIGALLGAVAGKGTGDHDKSRYVWGAALGALAGSAIGGYMDKQEQEFRDELADSGVEVYREGDELRLYMPGSITFETGSAAISPDFFPVLDDVATILNRYDKTRLQIEGHTDDVGTAQYNQYLSESRAQSVKGYLLQSQLNPQRISTLGYGEYRPLVDNTDDLNRQKNRRVELKIIPNVENS